MFVDFFFSLTKLPVANARSPVHTHLLDCFHGWRRVLVAAQVDHDPSDIAQEGDGNGGTYERQQGFDHTQTDHVVSALRAVAWRERVHELTVLLSLSVRLHLQHVTYDVAERPDGLFAHVLVRRPKQS